MPNALFSRYIRWQEDFDIVVDCYFFLQLYTFNKIFFFFIIISDTTVSSKRNLLNYNYALCYTEDWL